MMLIIDGSQGEGGGQILRSALALSMVTGTPFRIEKIRAGRPKPGLLRQHLTAVHAAREISCARVDGADLRSQALTFEPGPIKSGEYDFAIGTAGSTTLVLQTILPALLKAPGTSTVTLEGGTHNPFAPPFIFLERAFAPLLNRMGAGIELKLERHGFYPAGGGRFTATIRPADRLLPISLTERGDITGRLCTATVACLPGEIGVRELKRVSEELNWPHEYLKMCQLDDCGPGNILAIEITSAHLTEVFVGFGEKGVLAEAVASDAAAQVKQYLAANVPVGHYLADQLLLPMALAGGGEFLTLSPSRHTTTNIDIIQRFLSVAITSEKLERDRWLVRISS